MDEYTLKKYINKNMKKKYWMNIENILKKISRKEWQNNFLWVDNPWESVFLF